MSLHRNALVDRIGAYELVDLAPRCGSQLSENARRDGGDGAQFSGSLGRGHNAQNFA